jgi:RNA polymerase sigma-70 factor, ECF subfamily
VSVDSSGQLTREELESIYDLFYAPLYRYVAKRTGSTETARDLTGDVFQRLVHSCSQGRSPTTSVRAWLYRTAHNVVVDHYRREAVRKLEPLDWNQADPGPCPAQQAELNIWAERALVALSQLTEDQQEVVALRFLEGMSLQETAEVVDKPLTAVKALQHRGLAALQRLLLPATAGERVR